MSIFEISVAIIGLSLLVVIHEGGHYLAARAFGMRVTRFSIGFGPVLARYQPKGSPTVFQICAIPFLAYVLIAGMNPAEDVDPDDPSLYPNKGVFARIVTIFAGPFANYLTASVLVFGLALSGWPRSVPVERMIIGAVEPGTPAAQAGLKPGDVVVRANAQPVNDVQDLIAVTKPRGGLATEYVIERGGKTSTLTITPAQRGGRGVIGVVPKFKTVYEVQPASDAARLALVYPYAITVEQLKGLASLVRQRSTDGLKGPIGMGKLVAERAGKGVAELMSILMLISVALGMFNLLPFPALDGGRLVFLGYELVTRRRPNERIEAVVHTVGLLVLLGVIVLVTIRDVVG
ncbi:MAG: M50 family metallopeptidase [Proteobacteria bacterium]|nr:M50 family metallopeptidase [Pseudomonadota bacterium]